MKPAIKDLLFAAALLFMLAFSAGCSTMPSLVDQLQTQAQLKDAALPVHLTDYGILMYGEKVLAAWGTRSTKTEGWNTTGQIALAGLSTGALVASGGSASPDVTSGLVGAFNFILQLFGILKPAERNDARHEGAAMILDARGAFLEALAAKKIYHVSNARFTPQGSIYFRQIGSAIKIVDRLIVGLTPRVEDLQAVKPVPIAEQPDP